MKILFVFTGGTIGSTLNGNTISFDESKSFKLIHAYDERYGIDFEYDAVEPYAELSENNTGDHIRRLAACVLENVTKGYDGIVVTHGTDTLQYSSAAIGYALGNDSIPVCFVSSNYPIENPQANGLSNLHGAITFIRHGLGKGAFVVYKNSGDHKTLVHRATRLLASKPFSDENASVIGSYYGAFDEAFGYSANEDYSEKADELAPLDLTKIEATDDNLLWIFPYPGMTYPELTKDVRHVLINTYHSGTLDLKSETSKRFFAKAKQKGVRLYLTGVTQGPKYDSVATLKDYEVVTIENVSPIAAYVKLRILLSSGCNPREYLKKSLAGDVFGSDA